MFRSLHMKLTLILLLLITSLMALVGAFLTTSVSSFYINTFYQQIDSVFGEEQGAFVSDDEVDAVTAFVKNNYGIMNHTREIFRIGNEVFWGNYRFSDTDATNIIGRYGVVDYGSVNYASKELVSTFEGLFLTDTYECIVDYFDADFKFEYILVSESYNVFFRARSINRNVIIGVNFGLQ